MKHGKGITGRILSMLLVLMMCIGMLPGTAFAAEGSMEAAGVETGDGKFRMSMMKAGRLSGDKPAASAAGGAGTAGIWQGDSPDVPFVDADAAAKAAMLFRTFGARTDPGTVEVGFSESVDAVDGFTVVGKGLSQAVPRDTGRLYVENRYIGCATDVRQRQNEDGSLVPAAYTRDEIVIPMRAVYVRRGGLPAYDIKALSVSVGFRDIWNNAGTMLCGEWLTEDNEAAMNDVFYAEIEPLCLVLDGKDRTNPMAEGWNGDELTYGFGDGDRRRLVTVSVDHAKGRVTEGWNGLVPDDVPWDMVEFYFNIVVKSNDPIKDMSSGCDVRYVTSVPLDPYMYLEPGDVELEHGPEPSGFEANGILAGGVGEVSVTKVFYLGSELNITEDDPRFEKIKNVFIPDISDKLENFRKLDYRFGKYTGELNLGNAENHDPVDGYPAATWTLRAYALNFDGNGGKVDVPDGPEEQVHRKYNGPGTDAEGTFSDLAGIGAARPGYAFKGWSTDPDGNGGIVEFLDGKYVIPDGYEDTLYAQWEYVGGFALPKTGGTGTAPYWITGSALALLAGLVLVRRRKRG